ncbi:MAG: sugar transferase [Chloroflexota bacterium]
MVRRYHPALLTSMFLAELVLTLGALKIAEIVRLTLKTGLEQRDQFIALQPWIYPLVLAIWAFFFLLLGAFDVRRRGSLLTDIGTIVLSVTLSMFVLASSFYLLALQPPDAPSRLYMLYFYLIDLALLIALEFGTVRALTILRRGGRHVRSILLIGGGVRARQVAVRLEGRDEARVAGYLAGLEDDAVPGLTRLGEPADALELVRDRTVDEVIITLPAESHPESLRLAAELRETGVPVRIMPDVFEMVAMKARVDDFYGLPLISVTEPSIGPMQSRVKRAFDLVIAGLLTIILSPLLLAIALWIRLDSSGPSIIRQMRVGARGRDFAMYKFRSMCWQPAALDDATEKQPLDPRITRAGRFLRRSSLDELPQLWNVLRGEMSLVGPRPELPAIVASYEPWQRKRFNVPPGMTGWWQVNGRADRSMHLNTEIDLFYLQNYSILLDLRILARTVGAVIRGKGAY